jgi:8-oxo-dGTP pyrophosphatase MutT (NUDIX family)
MAGIHGVGIILVDQRGRFLLNRRSDDPDERLRGRWVILAGGIEPGETPERAALREVREETGHPAPRVHLVVRVSSPTCRGVYLYAAGLSVPGDHVILSEGAEHRLVSLGEVGGLSPRAPLLRPVLRAFAGTAAYQACLRDARQASP